MNEPGYLACNAPAPVAFQASERPILRTQGAGDAGDDLKSRIIFLIEDASSGHTTNLPLLDRSLQRFAAEAGDFEYFKMNSVKCTKLLEYETAHFWSQKAFAAAANPTQRAESLANLSDDYLAAHKTEDAFACARRSLRLAPTPQGYVNLAIASLLTGDAPSADRVLREAYACGGAVSEGVVAAILGGNLLLGCNFSKEMLRQSRIPHS